MMSQLELIAVAVAFTGIALTAKRSLFCWPVNLLACILYAKIFFDVRLYADMVLQGLFSVAVLYGWFEWRKGKALDGEVVVVAISPLVAFSSLAVGAIGAVAIGAFLAHFTNGSLPWLDASLTSFSLVAQYWAARRHAENWLMWIVVDIFYVGMFIVKDMPLTAVLYAAFTVIAIFGYVGWRRAATNIHVAKA